MKDIREIGEKFNQSNFGPVYEDFAFWLIIAGALCAECIPLGSGADRRGWGAFRHKKERCPSDRTAQSETDEKAPFHLHHNRMRGGLQGMSWQNDTEYLRDSINELLQRATSKKLLTALCFLQALLREGEEG